MPAASTQSENYGAASAVKLGFVAFALALLISFVLLKAYKYQQFIEFETLSVMDPIELKDPAPAFTLPVDDKAQSKSLGDFKGGYTLVHFWATWCAPCRKELSGLEYFSRQYKDKVQVLALSVDDNWPAVNEFFAGQWPSFQLLWDKDRKVAERYGTRQYPETYLVDPQGQLVAKFVGARPWDSTEAQRYFDNLLKR